MLRSDGANLVRLILAILVSAYKGMGGTNKTIKIHGFSRRVCENKPNSLGVIDDAISAAPDEPTTLDPMWWVELGSRLGKTVVAAVACVYFPEARSPHYI